MESLTYFEECKMKFNATCRERGGSITIVIPIRDARVMAHSRGLENVWDIQGHTFSFEVVL